MYTVVVFLLVPPYPTPLRGESLRFCLGQDGFQRSALLMLKEYELSPVNHIAETVLPLRSQMRIRKREDKYKHCCSRIRKSLGAFFDVYRAYNAPSITLLRDYKDSIVKINDVSN